MAEPKAPEAAHLPGMQVSEVEQAKIKSAARTAERNRVIRLNLISDRSFPLYLLSDVVAPIPENVTATHLYAPSHHFVLSSTLSVPRSLNPLRKIAARFPRYEVSWFDCTERLAWYVDTLECGHQITVFPQADDAGKVRHRCPECGKAISKKKPNQSVKPNRERAA